MIAEKPAKAQRETKESGLLQRKKGGSRPMEISASISPGDKGGYKDQAGIRTRCGAPAAWGKELI